VAFLFAAIPIGSKMAADFLSSLTVATN